MARLFGFIGNRSDLGPRVLEVEAAALRVHAGKVRLAWGLGFYQGGEVLLRRRPMDERRLIVIPSLTRDVHTDALIGTVQPSSQGEPRTQNTQPFRFRQWLFTQTGSLQHVRTLRDRLTETIPDFLVRNVRGDTDAELVFHLFLSFLHDASRLGDLIPPRTAATAALRKTVSLMDSIAAEEGLDNCGALGLLVSNGEYLAALTRDTNLAYRALVGDDDVEAILPDDGMRRRRLPDMAHVRFTIVADGFEVVPAHWKRLPARCTIGIGRVGEPDVEEF